MLRQVWHEGRKSSIESEHGTKRRADGKSVVGGLAHFKEGTLRVGPGRHY